MKIDKITEESIVQLVDTFYQQIRETPELKDIFENAIGKTKEDWHDHLNKMYAFWSSLMLRSGRYDGNPMKAHKDLPYFPPELFDVWLNVFKKTVNQIFNDEISALFLAKSMMITRTLKAGIYTE